MATRELLADGRPRRAREIAAALSTEGRVVDKRDVNSALYHENSGEFYYDEVNYTYSLTRPAMRSRPLTPAVSAPEVSPVRCFRCKGRGTIIVVDRDGLAESRPCSCGQGMRSAR
jgi:hypothetical protein